MERWRWALIVGCLTLIIAVFITCLLIANMPIESW
jgi:hypothetical protein